MDKLFFTEKNPLKEALSKEKQIFNFLNMYSLWLFENNKLFRKGIGEKENINFPDGTFISWKLGMKKQRGPTFTKNFLFSNNAKKKRHFFIGLNKNELKKLSKVTGIFDKNIGTLNPSFISGIEFSKEDKKKMIKEINRFKTDYLWVCVGNPKQEILSDQIFDSVKVNKILNVGAALDFLLGRKKESPLIFRKLGIEWLYRLITDFKYSYKKVLGSLIGLGYLGRTRTE